VLPPVFLCHQSVLSQRVHIRSHRDRTGLADRLAVALIV
jgi:hypothetical protein